MVILRENYKNTALFAVATVKHWLKNIARPNDIQYAYTELEDKLRQCHLNNVVGRLRSQENVEIEMIGEIQICTHNMSSINTYTRTQTSVQDVLLSFLKINFYLCTQIQIQSKISLQNRLKISS